MKGKPFEMLQVTKKEESKAKLRAVRLRRPIWTRLINTTGRRASAILNCLLPHSSAHQSLIYFIIDYWFYMYLHTQSALLLEFN